MSELKSFIVLYDGKFIRAYEESEADKVITHHKYKRCVAMAKICENRLGTVVKPRWWDKWRKIWLALAKKFKEVK